MTKTRNLSDLLDANGDVKLDNLDNVPASNDASALTTGTLPIARIADGDITTAKLADSSVSLAKLTATGTKDATTFLRGDNTFAEAGGGLVLQVVHGSTTTAVTSSSSTEITTGLTAQITPSSTSNKILVFGSENGIFVNGTSTAGAWKIRRHDTSTSATSGTNIQSIVNYGGKDDASSDSQYALSFNDLDSPSTTDARNYTITFNRSLGSGSVQVQNNSATSSITLMEIEA